MAVGHGQGGERGSLASKAAPTSTVQAPALNGPLGSKSPQNPELIGGLHDTPSLAGEPLLNGAAEGALMQEMSLADRTAVSPRR